MLVFVRDQPCNGTGMRILSTAFMDDNLAPVFYLTPKDAAIATSFM